MDAAVGQRETPAGLAGGLYLLHAGLRARTQQHFENGASAAILNPPPAPTALAQFLVTWLQSIPHLGFCQHQQVSGIWIVASS